MPLLKPQELLKMEIRVKNKGYDIQNLADAAIVYYFTKFIDEKMTSIPKEFLNLFEKNVYLESVNISHNIYKKVYEYVKNVPYGVSDIISYAFFLYYKKILQE